MKSLRSTIAAAMLTMLPVISIQAAADQVGNFTLTTGVTLDTFDDDSPQAQAGAQWSCPLRLAYQRGGLALSFYAAYADVAVEQSGDAPRSSDLAHLADSMISGSYTWAELPFGALTAGFAVNLPTGKASLNASERDSEAGENHDLLTIDDFGVGWKTGVMLGVARAFGAVAAGVSGNYVYTSVFDPTSDTPDDDLDPGDEWMLTTLANWAISERIMLDSTLTYTYYTPDRVEGEKRLQPGGNVALSSSLRLRATPQLHVAFQASATRYFKRKEYVDDSLRTEPENSANQEVSGALIVNYRFSERLAFQGQTDVRYYAESDRCDRISGFPYAGQRVRYGIGGGAAWQVNDALALNGGAAYFRMNQEQDLDYAQDVTYRGINLNVGVVVRF